MTDYHATSMVQPPSDFAAVRPPVRGAVRPLAEIPASEETAQQETGGFPRDKATIAIIDDEEVNIEVVIGYLEAEGYRHFVTTVDSTNAVNLIRRSRPDAVLLDVMMPVVSGLDILAEMRTDSALNKIPVVVLTACTDTETKLHALRLGPSDFLGKPVDPSELLLRLQNVLSVKAYQDQLAVYSQHLEHLVEKRTAELAASRQQIIQCLARAAEFRDDDTGYHILRVGRFAAVIARELGFDETWIGLLEQAAQLHDVGKIGIPDGVLLKEGRLDPDEFNLMKRHCGFGNSIIQPMSTGQLLAYRRHTDIGSRLLDVDGYPIMEMAATIAQTHHERWDGTGYPLGLAKTDIPIEGRITAVADVYDALSSKRPYKPAFPKDKCFGILREGRRSHFDPEVLDAFFARSDEITKIQIRFADIEGV